jgi:hypothetical protein
MSIESSLKQLAEITARTQLRDQFAGLALQGMLAGKSDLYPEEYASWAYAYADAMLEARDK